MHSSSSLKGQREKGRCQHESHHAGTHSSCACQHARLTVWLSSMEGPSFSLFALVLLQNHPLSKDTRPGPPSTSRYSYPLVAVLQDYRTGPSFGYAGVWTQDHIASNLALNPLSYHISYWATTFPTELPHFLLSYHISYWATTFLSGFDSVEGGEPTCKI
jgi:hypothetical protein